MIDRDERTRMRNAAVFLGEPAATELERCLDCIDELAVERAATLNLLAVLHRDGGHHTEAVGFEASCLDACHVCNDLRVCVDELRVECEALEVSRSASEEMARRAEIGRDQFGQMASDNSDALKHARARVERLRAVVCEQDASGCANRPLPKNRIGVIVGRGGLGCGACSTCRTNVALAALEPGDRGKPKSLQEG